MLIAHWMKDYESLESWDSMINPKSVWVSFAPKLLLQTRPRHNSWLHGDQLIGGLRRLMLLQRHAIYSWIGRILVYFHSAMFVQLHCGNPFSQPEKRKADIFLRSFECILFPPQLLTPPQVASTTQPTFATSLSDANTGVQSIEIL